MFLDPGLLPIDIFTIYDCSALRRVRINLKSRLCVLCCTLVIVIDSLTHIATNWISINFKRGLLWCHLCQTYALESFLRSWIICFYASIAFTCYHYVINSVVLFLGWHHRWLFKLHTFWNDVAPLCRQKVVHLQVVFLTKLGNFAFVKC